MKTIRNAFRRLLSVIKPHAGYYVEFILGLIMLTQGLAEGWPGSQLPDQDAFEILTTESAEIALSIWQIVAGILIIAGVTNISCKYSKASRRVGTFLAFLSLSFITILGIISHEGNQIFWIATAGLALLSGIVHIRLGWKDE